MRPPNRTKCFLFLSAGLSLLLYGGCGTDSEGPGRAGPATASIEEILPHMGSEAVPVTSLVIVRFSRGLSPAEARAFSIEIFRGGHQVPSRQTLLFQGSTLVLDPLEGFAASSTYEVRGLGALRASADPSAGSVEVLTRFSTSEADRGGPEFLFDPVGEADLFPFPSNVETVPDDSSPTGLRARIPHGLVPPNVPAEELDTMDGFGLYPRFILPVSRFPDEKTLPGSPEEAASPLSPLFLIDLDAGGDRCVPLFIEPDPFGPFQVPPRFLLKVMPLYPLEPERRYALVVTRRLADREGAPAEASRAFRKIVDGEADEGERGRRAFETIRPVLEWLEAPQRALPLDPGDLALVLPYTTRSLDNLTDELVAIRDYLARQYQASPPRVEISSLTLPGTTAPGASGEVALYVKGTVEAPDFRNRQGVWDPELVWSHPELAPRVPLEFLLSLPKKSVQTPAPVVIFLHGINDSKEAMYHITEALASSNFAAIAIDIVEHGSRATTTLMPWIPFLRLDDLQCGRDNMRQTQADLMTLAWAIRTSLAAPDLFYWPEADAFLGVDPDRMFFIGNSLGSILSPAFLALEDGIQGAALYVGAGNLTEVVTRYEAIAPGTTAFEVIGSVIKALRGIPIADIFYGMLDFAQEIFDKADPLTFAPYVLQKNLPGSHRAKDVLFIQVIGDQTLANTTNEHLARALGLDVVEPVKRPFPGMSPVTAPVWCNGPRGTTAAMIQFDEITVAGQKVTADHNNILRGEEPIAAVLRFFGSIAATGTGVIEDTRR